MTKIKKAECLDLPEITEDVRHVELEPKAMKMYKELEKESFTELGNGEVSAPNILTKLLRLSQMTGGHLTDDEGHISLVSKAKIEMLEDIIDSSLAEGKKLVVMARFVPELDDIEALLTKKKIEYFVLSRRKFYELIKQEGLSFIAYYGERKLIIRSEFAKYLLEHPELRRKEYGRPKKG